MEKKDTLSSCSESEEQQMQLIQDKSKESCMVSFQRLHSHLKCLLNNDLKGSRTEDGFKRAFTTLFCQDLETFTGTMFLNMDQLEKQLDNKEFQEIGSMASFKVLETQFQMFINSQIYLNDEYIVMTRNYFLEYTRLDIPEFRDTLIQNMDYVKKSIEKRALHKMEYDSRVNERLMQTTEEKVDSSKALDASLVIIESNGTESQEQDTSSRSGNDAHVDDADIRPIYNEEPMAEVQTTAEINVFAIGQQHTEQPELNNNEGKVDQNPVQASVVNVKWCLLKITLQAPFLNVQMTFEHSSSSLGHQCQMVSAENNTSGPIPQCQMTFEHSSSSLGHQCQMVSAENNTSGPVPQCQMTFEQRSSSLGRQCQMMSVHISSGLVLHQMTSDHNRSELRIQDHSNEPSSSKLWFQKLVLRTRQLTSDQELVYYSTFT
ncbi:hypothetical protein Tco_1438579 [Tanacetum coccineum]